MVNAVLTNMPIYLCSIFKALTWVTKRIEAFRRDFFLFGDLQSNERGWLVAWKNVSRSKTKGGLCVLDLSLMNDALMTKWWWRFFIAQDLQYNKLTRVIYYLKRKPPGEGRAFRLTAQWWRNVVKLKELFRGGFVPSRKW